MLWNAKNERSINGKAITALILSNARRKTLKILKRDLVVLA